MMGEKKIKGRKRQITVDVLGCLLHVYTHAANLSDTKVACSIVDYLIDKYPSLEAFSGDGGFRGAVVNYVQEILGKSFDIAIGIKGVGKFIPVPIRWAVERTISWFSNFRRTIVDYEIIPGNAENVIRIAMIKIMLAKLK
jgi:putative transposase